MKCPVCGLDNNIIYGHDTKSKRVKNSNGIIVRRYRRCLSCEYRFITVERYAKDYSKPVAYIKKR